MKRDNIIDQILRPKSDGFITITWWEKNVRSGADKLRSATVHSIRYITFYSSPPQYGDLSQNPRDNLRCSGLSDQRRDQ